MESALLNISDDFVKDNTILQVVAGSHAYGTNLPTSDWDERGIFIDNMERIMLPFEKVEQHKFEYDDIVVFELSKFMPLLLEQNPNVIELIWTAPEDVLKLTKEGQILLDHRQDFLTLKIKDSYVGYARSQLGRIKGHNKWINNPQPEKEPEPIDFFSVVWNYSENKEFNKSYPRENYFAINLGDNHFGLFENTDGKFPNWVDKRGNPNPLEKGKIKQIHELNKKPEIIVKFNQKSFDDIHSNWKSYWTWKKNRNEKRAELEIKHGYDTKHAMHLIRLLKSGCEILEHNQVFVKREDKDFLLSIRDGKYTYDEVIKMSEDLTNKVQDIAKKSTLPSETNYELAKSLMVKMYSEHWGLQLKNEHKNKLKIR